MSVASDSTRRWVLRGALLVVTFVSLYLLLPSLVEVFSSWRSLTKLNPWWAVAAVPAEVASFGSTWLLQRIALRTKAWFPVAASQLSATASSRIVPGGGATSVAIQLGMLRRAGIGGGRAAAALAASGALTTGALLALPLFSLPAILGGVAVAHSLELAAYLGLAVLALLVTAGIVAFVTDRPLAAVGRALQAAANMTIRRKRPLAGVAEKVLQQRDFVKATIGRRWFESVTAATAVPVFDFMALLCALAAVGARPNPSLVLLAYVLANLLAWIPITPGGLGFVEAGLVSTLVLAGVDAGAAGLATLYYRLIAFWLPIPAGGVAYLAFRHRYGKDEEPAAG
jgi:uncharacterized membrane protein YbhN (UPF0104 family)